MNTKTGRQAPHPVTGAVPKKTPIQLGRESYGNFVQATEYEWLLTNGLGGFASGTVAEANTRRYHGLLMIASKPPVERTLLVSKIDITAHYQGHDWPLFSNEFSDGTVEPKGYHFLESFHLDRGMPVWRYACADALIEKRLLMEPGRNVTQLALRVVGSSAPVEFTLAPLCAYRDYHSHGKGGWEMQVEARADGFQIIAFPGAHPYHVSCHDARFTSDPVWYWSFRHRVESDRGLDDTEDLFRPGYFILDLDAGEQTSVIINAETEPAIAFTALTKHHNEHYRELTLSLPVDAPDWIAYLAHAADQFIVDRLDNGRPTGKTIIAGYPWFGDWGRDTMIALTGLTLVTKRYAIAAHILMTFAGHVSAGMIPNRFPDGADQPEYNTADATLWYFYAIAQYTRRSGDEMLATELYPALREIIDWHQRGSRYGIGIDPEDGLLRAGEPGMQLTWMDAKVDDQVVTPRIGKPVEINALWYNALIMMAELAQRLGHDIDSRAFRKTAAQVENAFGRFWNPALGYLYDVIDGPGGDPDESLRPNQILAVSLPHSPLSPQRQKAVVDICTSTLLTPFGLRSLAPDEPEYAPHYAGGVHARDGAYHQGTVWAWLIGPFVDAHYRVYRDAKMARAYLGPFGQHLAEAGLGQISEIFDAEPPFTPRGCFAQAWSVAEVLRAWADLAEVT